MAESRSPFDHKHEITIEIDETMITGVNDETLAFWWRLAQHNPADAFADPEPGKLAMKIGWEIIRRWLAKAPVELYHHQQEHYTWRQLTYLGKWNADREFVPHAPVADPKLMAEALEEAALHARLHGDHSAKADRYDKARAMLERGMRAAESGTGKPEATDG